VCDKCDHELANIKLKKKLEEDFSRQKKIEITLESYLATTS
jgi:transcription initiation factor IIE alpha subunit